MKLQLTIWNWHIYLIPANCELTKWRKIYKQFIKLSDISLYDPADYSGKILYKFKVRLGYSAKLEIYTLDSIISSNKFTKRTFSKLTDSEIKEIINIAKFIKESILNVCVSLKENISLEPDEMLDGEFGSFYCIKYCHGKSFSHDFIYKADKHINTIFIEKVLFNHSSSPIGLINETLIQVFNEVISSQTELNIPTYNTWLANNESI